MNKFYNQIMIFFSLLFFPAFVTGVFLPNLVIFLIILSTIIFKFEDLKKLVLNNLKLVKFFIAFYLVIIFSSILSNNKIHSLESSLLYFAYLLFVFSLTIFFLNKKKNSIVFFSFGLITFLIICLDATFEIIFGYNTLGFSSISGRLAGLFNDRWVIGSYLVRFLPILLGIFFININYFSKFQKILISLIFFYSSFIIVFSGERVAYLLLLLFIALMFIFLIFKLRSKLILFLILFLSFMLFIIPLLISEKTSNRLKSNIISNITQLDPETNQYFALYSTSLKLFQSSPIIGIGPNNFRNDCKLDKAMISNFSCSSHPHHTYLQALAELGIIGFAFIFSTFLFFVKKTYKAILTRKFDFYLLGFFSINCAFILNLWPFIPSGNFFNSWLGYFYFLPLSFYLLYKDNKDGGI